MTQKISYKQLGLSNSKEIFKKAYSGGYAIPGYNFNNLEQLQAIVKACVETSAPVILQVSKGARNYADPIMLRYMALGAVEYAKDKGSNIPIILHLDHGDSFEICKDCIDSGFSSVMIDGSHLSFKENIEVSKKVVEYAHKYDVSVEGELGVLAGIEDEVSSEKSHYTEPGEVEEFVEKTGIDSLAISIGTSHGAYKFKLKPGETVPPLRFDILEEIEKRLPGFPIVLHGSSSVVPEYIDIINKFGGKLEGAVGVPEDQLRRASKSSVCKINIDSDGRLAVTAMVRKNLQENPENFDPRKYLGQARTELEKLIKHKNINVLGCNNKA
jgi:fructose-bisphosphate aldolase, class II